MSKEEIEEWLEHIPVFAVTDSKGAGVVLKPENDTSVFYFFLVRRLEEARLFRTSDETSCNAYSLSVQNPLQANATLQQLKGANEEMDLKVSAFSLGRIWFNLLNSDSDQEVMLKSPGSEDSEGEATKGVEYRLIPDTRDLLGARMLLTMSPEDGEKMKKGESMTPEIAQAAIKKAMTESPKFNSTFNEIPVFTISQMRMQKQASEGEDGEPITLLPMYFSLSNMVGTWQQFMSQAAPEVQGVEPAINLMSLHDLVEMMQKESEIDWRHVVLVPPTQDSASASSGATTSSSATTADPMAQMGGATLGDDD